ncbi:MAG: DEAD/DEAH box helicase, partial [Solirubrobacteraceae bacterium]
MVDLASPIGRLGADEILDRFVAWSSGRGLVPYPAQEEAFLELLAGKHVVLATPTGSGKSLVATLLHFKAMCEGKRSFYTSPVKALVSEKFFTLCADFGPENVGMLTGDASINSAAPIVCCTAEVLANMALRQGAALSVPYVVMDEFHYYSDAQRGMAWQVPLLMLPDATFLLMSATLGDTREIRRDLETRSGRPVALVASDVRPVPLDFDYCDTPLHETVAALLESGKAPIYVVSFTQREAAELAQALTS